MGDPAIRVALFFCLLTHLTRLVYGSDVMEHTKPDQYGATCLTCGDSVPFGFLHVHECAGRAETFDPVPANTLPGPNRDRIEGMADYIAHLCARIGDYAAKRDGDQLEVTARMLSAAVDEFVAETKEPK